MKRFALALFAFATLGPGLALAKEATTTLQVSGWHCSGCSSKTEAALKEMKGVKSVNADLDKKQIAVAYDDKLTNEAALKDAVRKLGYAVDEKAPVKKN